MGESNRVIFPRVLVLKCSSERNYVGANRIAITDVFIGLGVPTQITNCLQLGPDIEMDGTRFLPSSTDVSSLSVDKSNVRVSGMKMRAIRFMSSFVVFSL